MIPQWPEVLWEEGGDGLTARTIANGRQYALRSTNMHPTVRPVIVEAFRMAIDADAKP